MVWKYKEFKIELNNDTGKFSCGELHISDKPSLDSVKSEIDTHLKSQLKKGFEAYLYDSGYYGDGKAEKVTVTSITETTYGNEFWIKDDKGNRRKVNELFKLNTHNEELFYAIRQLKVEMKKLEKEIDNHKKKLQEVKVEDVKSEGQDRKSYSDTQDRTSYGVKKE